MRRLRWPIVVMLLMGVLSLVGAIRTDARLEWFLTGFDFGVALAFIAVSIDGHRPRPTPDPTERLMQAGESLTALYDFAEGQRAELERRGFSPTAAEMVVASWLANGGHS